MGNISPEEMQAKSDQEIKNFKADDVKKFKPETKVVYDRRLEEIKKKEEEKKQPVVQQPDNTGENDAAGGSQPAENSGNQSAAADAGMAEGGYGKNQAGKKTLKLVLTGDTAVGKSCMITNYLNNTYTDIYEPTVLDVYKGIKNVQKKQIEIEIHDTSGDEHLGINRKVQYQGADVFMICVACNSQDSLDNVGRWKAEIQEIEASRPIAIILTKQDLADQIDNAVTLEDIEEAKEQHSLQISAGTSSKEWEDFNVHKAFTKTLTFAYRYKYED